MSTKRSAGILLYRRRAGRLEVLLAHPGGPWWRNKDAGAWGIPKGLIDAGEDPLAAARREFEEETGQPAPAGEAIALTPLRQASGKLVLAWALEGDCDTACIRSNDFPMEWPPRSGQVQQFPEIDRAEWFALDAAREKAIAGQRAFLDELERVIAP